MAVYPERRSGRLTGKWIAEVTSLGKRRRDRFDTKHEAERWSGFVKLTGNPPEEAAKADAPVHPFGVVVKEALERHPGWAGNRDPSRQQRLTYAVDVLGAATPIAAIKRADLDRLVASLQKRPAQAKGKKLSAGTINRYLTLVSAVMTYARAQGYLDTAITFPWQKEEGRRIHWLSDEDEAVLSTAMLAAGRRDEELTLRVLTRTGMRWSELEGLEPHQVTADWIKLDATKTDTPRDIPIAPELAGELKALVERKGVPTYYTFRNTLKRALKSAGQNPKLTIHCLRHSTASRLVTRGVNLAVVQQFLGHKSIATTTRYTHVTPTSLQDALQKISPHAGQSEKPAEAEVPETLENSGLRCRVQGLNLRPSVYKTDK